LVVPERKETIQHSIELLSVEPPLYFQGHQNQKDYRLFDLAELGKQTAF
jgi:hypothetical protein